jgi:hypothetical protein
MKGFTLSLPAANMNCSKGEKPDSQLQPNNATNSINGNQKNPLDAVIFQNQKGTIHLYVCTRGCYQYVLETELGSKLYKLSPDVLDDAFKKDKLSIIFSGKTTGELVDINKPAPNDAPIFDFKAPKVVLENIRVKL